MDTDPPAHTTSSLPTPESERLGSWKEIARYLDKTVRTVQRWESRESLPVHRLQHDSGSTVYAYTHELDQWLTHRSQVIQENVPPPISTAAEAPIPPPSPAKTLGNAPHKQRLMPWVLALTAISLVAIFIALQSRNPAPVVPQPETVSVPVMLTTEPGVERFPTVSPNGSQVVYSWDRGNNEVDLYLRLIGVDDHLQLTDSESVEESPAWSPDGLSIAFLRRTDPGVRELRIIPAIGGAERLIHTFPVPLSLDLARSVSAGLDWSPDGRWIAITEQADQPEAARITVLDPQTGEKISLTNPENTTVELSPQFSPDGQYLAFTRSPSALTGQIMVMEFIPEAPDQARQWALPEANLWNAEPAWTPDSRDIVFTSGPWPRTRLWRMPADGSAQPQPLTATSQGASQPTVAMLESQGDGSTAWQIAYTVVTLENDIWRIDLSPEGRAQTWLSSSQRERFPAYSSDERIAFLSDRSGFREIWLADRDGENWQQWTDWKSAYIWRPSFSPDGRTLAYTVATDQRLHLHVQDGPLAPARSLSPDEANDTDLAWSADGKTLYTASTGREGQPAALWAVDVVSGNASNLLEGQIIPLGESPDRRWLIYARYDDDPTQLERLNLQSGETQVIPIEGQAHHSHTLGPDGVYFLIPTESGAEIHRWAWTDEQQSLVKTLDMDPEIGLAISPDGQYALLARIILQRSDLMRAPLQP